MGRIFMFFWGRGNGWVAAGMEAGAAAVPSKNHPQRARIMEGLSEDDGGGVYATISRMPPACGIS